MLLPTGVMNRPLGMTVFPDLFTEVYRFAAGAVMIQTSLSDCLVPEIHPEKLRIATYSMIFLT